MLTSMIQRAVSCCSSTASSPALSACFHSLAISSQQSHPSPARHTSLGASQTRSIHTIDIANAFRGKQARMNPAKKGMQQKKPKWTDIPLSSNSQYVIDPYLRRKPRKQRRGEIVPELIPPDQDLDDASWRIVGGVIIQRGPILAPKNKPWEEEWQAWNLEQDRLYGLHLPDWIMQEGNLPDAHRLWRPAPDETEEDKTGDIRTTNRRLRDDLFLLVKKDRAEHAWQFPQGGNLVGESLRDTVDREILEQLGENLQVHVLANHPHGYLKYKFPDGQSKYNKFKGTKLFLFRSVYVKGKVAIDKDMADIEDFAWVTRAELKDYLPPNTLELAYQMLPVPVPYRDVEYVEP